MRNKIFELEGKVAIVTGGGSGLGRVFCEALAEFGANISIVDINEKGAKETAELVENFKKEALVIKADVSNPEDVKRAIDETLRKFGRIDILINNAGINAQPAPIAEIPIEDWDRVLAVNLKGVFLCTRAVLPVMVKQKKGNIINIASILGIRALFELSEIMPMVHYSVSKAGVIILTKQTAIEYAKDGIRANCIAPGWFRGTKLSAHWKEKLWREEQQKKYENTIKRITPLGRRGELEELKGLIIFLASDASSYITGQVIIIDGGICV